MARAERDRTGNATSNAGPNAGPEPRRRIPSVDALLRSEPGRRAIGTFGRPLVKHALSVTLEQVRQAAEEGARCPRPTTDPRAGARAGVGDRLRPGPRDQRHRRGAPHGSRQGAAAGTGRGRGGAGRTGLRRSEVDRESGARGRRSTRAERLLTSMTGAEDALVVNNGAAALLLALASLARGKGVLVSRGELIEIGGEFRIPDIIGGVGRAARRGRHDEPDAQRRLPFGADRQDRADPQGASQQLPRRGLRLDAQRQDLAAIARKADVPFVVRPRFRACSNASRAPRRTSRARPTRSPTGPTSSCSRATSCSAGRRPGSCSDAASWSSVSGGTRSRAPCASTRCRWPRSSPSWRNTPTAGVRSSRVDDAPRAAGARAAPRGRAR